MYTNSTKDLNVKREDIKNYKIPGNTPAFIANKSGPFDSTSPKNGLTNGKPSFLDGKGEPKNPLKGSVFMDKN